jgi:HAD superfamily hydrolase (TIGR01484 family)
MRYLVLACDYDGTLARDGRVDEPTIAALRRLRESGRLLVLVTGRQLDEVLHLFPPIDLFDRVVAENGAVLYRPANREERLLAEGPPEKLVTALRARAISPLAVGRAIVASFKPHETTILEVIRDLGLEMQVIFNKGSVMVLPSGTNKASGLSAALGELGLSPHNCVGVGDAENDHAFLALCECAVAVANALPSLRDRADLVTEGDHGVGVIELVERLVSSDLRELEPRLERHAILLGAQPDGREVRLPPYRPSVMLAGPSGSGKSTLATGFLERLVEGGYQVSIVDPEGDYRTFERAVVLGDQERAPTVDEALDVLQHPDQNAVVNLLGVPLKDRPGFFASLFPRLQEMRVRTGRPHWIVVDEAHHLFPASWDKAELTLSQGLFAMLLITVHPEHVAPPVVAATDVLVVVGGSPEEPVRGFTGVLGAAPPALPATKLESGEAMVWFRRSDRPPLVFRVAPPRLERRRHVRKYAEGELGPDKSFYFRGPGGKLNLRAQNLMVFLQIAEGVDDETWLYHLQCGDYSRWARESIKDQDLASEIAHAESLTGLSPADSRARVRASIEQRYTLPS